MKPATTLLELIESHGDERTAIIVPETNTRVTYDSLSRQVLAMAETLAGAGIGRNDRIAIALPNGLPAIVAFLAASLAGTAAPMNHNYRSEEFRFYLEDTAARLLICPPTGAEEARKAARDRLPVLSAAQDASGAVYLEGASKRAALNAPSAGDIALVLHTSGSTGRPKRVPLRHGNLAVSAANVAGTYALTPEDVSLCVMPLFHIHGLVASTLATLLSGGTVVVPMKFNPLAFWRLVREERVTWYSAVPTIHHLLLERAARLEGANRPGTLRFARSCSSPLSPQTMRQVEEAFGIPLLEAYGMTEAAHQMASNPLPPHPRKAGSVGPGTGVRISIMDERGNHLEAGQRGEVVIQGPNVFNGYENNPEANSTAFTDGWFRTGDEGRIDGDGYLQLTGRIKELINRAGEKIAPRQIDEVLLSHPAVAEAVAFGFPHPVLGEEVAAAVVLRTPESESALLKFCRQHLAAFECPKKLHIIESIPRTATGKVQRRAVAKAILDEAA